jgi:hypothetical protein
MDISAFMFGFIYVILIVVIFSDVCNAVARFTGFSNVWRFSHWLPKCVTRLNYLPWMPFSFLLFDALVSDAWVWRPTTLYTWPAPRGLACDVIVSQHPTFPTPPYPIFVCMCVCVCVWERERERDIVSFTFCAPGCRLVWWRKQSLPRPSPVQGCTNIVPSY